MSMACLLRRDVADAGDGGRGEVRNLLRAAGHVIGEDGDGDAVVDENFVVGDEAGDFAAVFNGAMAVALASLQRRGRIACPCRLSASLQ